MSSTTTRKKCRSSEVKKILLNQFSLWRPLMWRKVYPTNWFASNKKCKNATYTGKDILISKKQRTVASNSKSHHSKEKKLHSNSNFSASKEESPNSRCKSEAKDVDSSLSFILKWHLIYQSIKQTMNKQNICMMMELNKEQSSGFDFKCTSFSEFAFSTSWLT